MAFHSTSFRDGGEEPGPKTIIDQGPMPILDFWFDFASTYSYPAAMRIAPLAAAAGVPVRFRPFLLGPIFKAQGWDTSPFNVYEAKGRHMWRDLERLCADLALPFRRPEPFPQNSLLAARVALVGLGDGWGEEFCRAVFQAEFAEGRRIDDPGVIRDILAGLNCDPAASSRSRAARRQQAAPAAADRRGAAARHLRRADLRHQRRRIVLGQRPAGTRAAMGARTAAAHAVSMSYPTGTLFRDHASSRIGRPAWAMCSLAWRMVYSPKWKIDAASTAVAWPSRMPSTR